MDIKTFIEKSLIELGVPLISSKRYKKDVVAAIIHGYRVAGWSPAGWRKFTKKYFPDKPDNVLIRTWLLMQFDTNWCPRCDEVLPLSNFNKGTGLFEKHTYCKTCQREKERPFDSAKGARRRADKLNRTPKWANLEKIKKIYYDCPKGYHVDHIIPLKGVKVSGLHVENNLQYLTAEDNIRKGNTFGV